jgi:hypothetical protein
LGEKQGASAHQCHTDGGNGPETDPEHESLPEDRADGSHGREDERGEPELDGGVAEHLLRVEGEHEAEPVREHAEDEHDRVCADNAPRAEHSKRYERCALP